jgi:hypothetical protein
MCSRQPTTRCDYPSKLHANTAARSVLLPANKNAAGSPGGRISGSSKILSGVDEDQLAVFDRRHPQRLDILDRSAIAGVDSDAVDFDRAGCRH